MPVTGAEFEWSGNWLALREVRMEEACPNCSEPREAGYDVCWSCGHSFRSDAPDIDLSATTEARRPDDLFFAGDPLTPQARAAFSAGRARVRRRLFWATLSWLGFLLFYVVGLLVVPVALLIHGVHAWLTGRRGTPQGLTILLWSTSFLLFLATWLTFGLLNVLATPLGRSESHGERAFFYLMIPVGIAIITCETRLAMAAVELREAVKRADD